MTRRAQDNTKALDAFIVAKTEIDAMLERLAALSADHFETSPDEINWGHVGTLNHYRAKLREIADMAFSEGEHVVEALLPPKAVAEALSMHKGEPCLVIQRRTWSGGKVVTFVRLWFPADRYRLVGRFSA